MLPTPPKIIIFDFDGVILNSTEIKLCAYAKLYAGEDPEKVQILLKHSRLNGGITRRTKIEHYERMLFSRSGDAESVEALAPKRSTFSKFDRLIFAGLYGLALNVLSALTIVKPETVIDWHRAGFRLYWRWKSRSLGDRPKLSADIRKLIHDVSLANPLCVPKTQSALMR